MAPLLFKEMKGVRKLSCASPASAAICTSIDKRSMVRSISGGGAAAAAGRALDRHNPHLGDSRRSVKVTDALSRSLSKTRSYLQKSRKSTSSEKSIQLVSPPGSSRFLLDEVVFVDALADPEQSPAPPLAERPSSEPLKLEEKDVTRPSSSTRPLDQVVVLKVSLHCKGCEGKVRKHISKMEGVTSFSIDFAEKKVTITGDVTPLGVLNSISKVKNAQLWQAPAAAAAACSPPAV